MPELRGVAREGVPVAAAVSGAGVAGLVELNRAAQRHPNQTWAEIEQLVVELRQAPYTEPLAHADGPNQVWCADFKGWFRTGDGARIDRLTLSDAHSRYLLRCQAVEKTDTVRVQAIFEAAFREYGLPRAIRTDNGAPFASTALAGLSRLAVWWIKLGLCRNASPPDIPSRTGGTSACIAP